MVTLFRDHLRIEAVAVPEPDGSCCVTAEGYAGAKMVRGLLPPNDRCSRRL